MRIVSCVPSVSELIFWLNPDCLAGRTRFCVFPGADLSVPRVGGTRNLDAARIRRLKPDLLVAVKEENDRGQIEALAREFPVRLFDVRNMADCIRMVRELGYIIGQAQKVKEWETVFNENWAGFGRVSRGTCLYLIWQKPWMAAGGDTFIHEMLTRAGFTNLFGHRRRYPETDLEEIARLEPGWILLSDEPYPFGEVHREQIQKLFPRSRVVCVDGAWFSWYSQRVAGMPGWLSSFFSGLSRQPD